MRLDALFQKSVSGGGLFRVRTMEDNAGEIFYLDLIFALVVLFP
jgi:hypothetical protein